MPLYMASGYLKTGPPFLAETRASRIRLGRISALVDGEHYYLPHLRHHSPCEGICFGRTQLIWTTSWTTQTSGTMSPRTVLMNPSSHTQIFPTKNNGSQPPLSPNFPSTAPPWDYPVYTILKFWYFGSSRRNGRQSCWEHPDSACLVAGFTSHCIPILQKALFITLGFQVQPWPIWEHSTLVWRVHHRQRLMNCSKPYSTRRCGKPKIYSPFTTAL